MTRRSASTSATTGQTPPGPRTPHTPAQITASGRIPPPSPLKRFPKLQDFSYKGVPFPDSPPPSTAEDSPLNRTIKIIAKILVSKKCDIAASFLVENKAIQRLFTPREVIEKNKIEDAKYEIKAAHHAKAMAWHLLDQGREIGQCGPCQNVNGKAPFTKCLVPRAEKAEGACTNCLFMGHASLCTHRIALLEKRENAKNATFGGLTAENVKGVTTDNLNAWMARINEELNVRNKVPTPKTPKVKKRVELN